MSGGSYNYLCHSWDLEDIIKKKASLEEMADDLKALGYADDAAQETYQLLTMLQHWEMRVTTHLNRMTPVWKAMEWWKSSDSSEASFRAALILYRGDHHPFETSDGPHLSDWFLTHCKHCEQTQEHPIHTKLEDK